MFAINLHIKKLIVEDIHLPKKKKKKPKYKVLTTIFIDSNNFNTITGKQMAVELKPNQKIFIAIAAVDRKGNPAGLESVSFSSDDESVATVVQDADNKMAAVITSHAIGVAKISYFVDDLDKDTDVDLEGFLAVEVTSEEAVGFGEVVLGPITDVEV